MADWYLNRALTNWRNAVNAAYPNRDETSDGTIGNVAHQASTSDHNPDSDGSVDAWDMDVDLRVANTSAELEKLKQVFQKHPAARYWIHNRQIASRSNGWRREYYSGANAHDHHIHWNSEPAYENSNLPWIIPSEEDLNEAQATQLAKIYETVSRTRAGMPTMADGKTVIVQTDWRVRDEAWQKAVNGELDALKLDIVAIREKVETPIGSVVITDEQLERVLRKVVGSVDDVA